MTRGLEFRLLSPELADALGEFFVSLAGGADEAFFHPHPLTREQARTLCAYSGADLYFAAVHEQQVLAYAMLRGWDEGYSVPSLGLAVGRAARGTGLGRSFMAFLHSAARLRGAQQIRLTVYEQNTPALRLYQSLGYQFEPKNDREWIGKLTL